MDAALKTPRAEDKSQGAHPPPAKPLYNAADARTAEHTTHEPPSDAAATPQVVHQQQQSSAVTSSPPAISAADVSPQEQHAGTDEAQHTTSQEPVKDSPQHNESHAEVTHHHETVPAALQESPQHTEEAVVQDSPQHTQQDDVKETVRVESPQHSADSMNDKAPPSPPVPAAVAEVAAEAPHTESPPTPQEEPVISQEGPAAAAAAADATPDDKPVETVAPVSKEDSAGAADARRSTGGGAATQHSIQSNSSAGKFAWFGAQTCMSWPTDHLMHADMPTCLGH